MSWVWISKHILEDRGIVGNRNISVYFQRANFFVAFINTQEYMCHKYLAGQSKFGSNLLLPIDFSYKS